MTDKGKAEKYLRKYDTPRRGKTEAKMQAQRDKAVAKDPDIRGVNRQESRRD